MVRSCASLANTPRFSRPSQTSRPSRCARSMAGPQPSAPDRIDLVRRQVLEHLRELLAQYCGALLVLAGGHHTDDLDTDRAREWVPTERASVLAGPEHAEDVASGYDRGQRQHASTERLAQRRRCPGRTPS